MNNSKEHNHFERRIFVTICLISSFFMAYYVMNDLVLGSYVETLIGDLAVFVIIIAFIVLVHFFPEKLFIWMNSVFILAIISITTFWPLLGGSNGPLPYTILFVISMIGILFPHNQRILYISILILLTILLVYLETNLDIVRPLNDGTIKSIPFDFILNLVGIALALTYLKNQFDHYNFQINESNINLQQVNNQLKNQNHILRSQGERIEKINRNLQQIVDERTLLLKEQRENIKKLAVHNAQDLHAPIINILGLLPQLSNDPNNPAYRELRSESQHIDQTIRKINDLLDTDL